MAKRTTTTARKAVKPAQFWTVVYTHKHGADSWTEVATDAASALAQAITYVNSMVSDEPFDPDRENLDVHEFFPPDGYKLVKC